MLKKMTRAIRGRVGPVGLSLVAAALTAVAFAAVSVAQENGDGKQGSARGDVFRPGPGGPPMAMRLSEADREALEEFRACMEEQGVEGPPAPPAAGEDGEMPEPPKPPTEAERAEIEKALEACEDKLPEGARGIGPHPCGPPPGAPSGEDTAIPAPPSGSQRQGAVAPAPQGASS